LYFIITISLFYTSFSTRNPYSPFPTSGPGLVGTHTPLLKTQYTVHNRNIDAIHYYTNHQQILNTPIKIDATQQTFTNINNQVQIHLLHTEKHRILYHTQCKRFKNNQYQERTVKNDRDKSNITREAITFQPPLRLVTKSHITNELYHISTNIQIRNQTLTPQTYSGRKHLHQVIYQYQERTLKNDQDNSNSTREAIIFQPPLQLAPKSQRTNGLYHISANIQIQIQTLTPHTYSGSKQLHQVHHYRSGIRPEVPQKKPIHWNKKKHRFSNSKKNHTHHRQHGRIHNHTTTSTKDKCQVCIR
jgi:hypothetical protein